MKHMVSAVIGLANRVDKKVIMGEKYGEKKLSRVSEDKNISV